MAVGFSNTNKPLNPRGQDASPKGYNRASLFSGKALDFDGVNDKVNITTDSFDLYAVSFYFKGAIGTATNGTAFSSGTINVNDGVTIGGFTASLTNETIAIGKDGNYTATNETFADGVHFICASWDATNSKYKIYVNGQEVDTFNNGSDAALNTGITAPALGYRKLLSDQYIDGGLSNVRAFNTALTAAQVADLYNNPEKVVPTGVDNTALKLWLPMMEGAGTTAYNGAPDALGSNVVTNGTFDTDSDWTKGTGWTISGGKANRSGASGNSPVYQNVPVVNGKRYVFSYTRTYVSGYGETNVFVKLDNVNYSTIGRYVSTITEEHKVIGEFTAGFTGNLLWQIYGITDFTGSIDNVEIKEMTGYGTISGATWTHGIGAPVAQTSVIDWNKHTLDGTNEVLIPQGLTSGRDLLGNLFENVRKQGALNLDGNSWAEVHDNASVDLTTALTLEAWVYNDGNETFKGVLSKWASAVDERCFMLYKQDVDDYRFDINGTSLNTGAAVASGWNHLVGVWDSTSTNKYFYVNGALSASTTQSVTINTSDNPVEIGTYGYTSANSFNNQIAQPRIYNRALTASEVLRNYNSGKNTYK